MVQDPKADSIEKLVNNVKERASYGEDKILSCSGGLVALARANKDFQYHKEW